MTNPQRRRVVDRIKSIEERLLLVTNPKSRKGAEMAGKMRSLVRREGMDLQETSTDHPDDIGSTIEFWSKRFGGSKVVMVFGGDGAVNQVINHVMLSRSNKNVVLVPFAAGTANDFCRAIGLESPNESLEAMIDFKVKPIDLLKIDIEIGDVKRTKYCSNIIGLGLDGDLARRSQKYKRFGVPGYWYASLRQAFIVLFKGMDNYRMRVKSATFDHYGWTLGIMFSNINQYGRTFRIAPMAKLNDGKIYVTLARPMHIIKAVIAAVSMTWGLQSRINGVDCYTCDEAEVELIDDIYTQEDGEVFFYPRGTKMRISLEPEALNVLVSSNGTPGIL